MDNDHCNCHYTTGTSWKGLCLKYFFFFLNSDHPTPSKQKKSEINTIIIILLNIIIIISSNSLADNIAYMQTHFFFKNLVHQESKPVSCLFQVLKRYTYTLIIGICFEIQNLNIRLYQSWNITIIGLPYTWLWFGTLKTMFLKYTINGIENKFWYSVVIIISIHCLILA